MATHPSAVRILPMPRRAALLAIAVLIAATAVASFAQSYRGLYEWADGHGLHGNWAYAWPVQVDTFIAVGELALFVALVDAWPWRSRVAAWIVTGIGLLVSVAGNVGHVAAHEWLVRATAAVPPVAAAAALAVGLGVLKRIVEQQGAASPGAVPDLPPDGTAPAASETVSPPRKEPIREVMRRHKVSQPTAVKMRNYAAAQVRAASTNGHGA